jgi:hypothetical protein
MLCVRFCDDFLEWIVLILPCFVVLLQFMFFCCCVSPISWAHLVFIFK